MTMRSGSFWADITDNADGTYTLVSRGRCGDAVRAICDENPRVLFGPDVRMLLTLDDYAPGNVHPNGPGHAKIAAALAEFLLALAQETPGAENESSASSNSEGSSQTRSAPADSSSARLP